MTVVPIDAIGFASAATNGEGRPTRRPRRRWIGDRPMNIMTKPLHVFGDDCEWVAGGQCRPASGAGGGAVRIALAAELEST